ncbi:MAG: ABC transporter ATP-binding protein [Candidatus Marinimicrobia bacterium]|nr:ABC transporter ATP-binding protein [Candidatus Neomarinimicrobiota bacterium]
MIELLNVTKSFYHKPLFRDLSVQFESGNMSAILGKNGAGKSTLLRIMAGLTAFESGRINVCGTPLKSNNPLSRKAVLYIGHAPGLYPPLSAVENLRIAAMFYGKNYSDSEILDTLSQVGLDRQPDDSIRIYSQGMMQRLKLALAILIPWKVLLFDEPFTGLDEEGRILTESLLKSWQSEDKTIILVVHNHEWAMKHCDHLLVLHDKGIGYDGKSSDAKSENIAAMLQGIA